MRKSSRIVLVRQTLRAIPSRNRPLILLPHGVYAPLTQYRMTAEDMAAFHRRFVTLTTLSAETGQHRNTLKGRLAARRVTPFSPEGQDFGAVYLRGDVMG